MDYEFYRKRYSLGSRRFSSALATFSYSRQQ